MELTFIYPWFVFAAALLAVGSGAVAFWKRRLAPTLLMLGAAAFLLAGARPQLGAKPTEVRHALVVDVSGSMATRPEVEALAESLQLPAGHSFARFELSDALRSGGARGEGTDYSRLSDLATDALINGEVVVITDGRGELGDLYGAVDPRRLILLRAPPPASPDAAILSLTAPTAAQAGGTITVRATVACDADDLVPWRLIDDSGELDFGNVALRADVPATIELPLLMPTDRLWKLTFSIELAGDREARNDRASVTVKVGSRRRIAYCMPKDVPPGNDALLQLLRSDQANEVEVRSSLPVGEGELGGTTLVVINNLPLAESGVAREQLAALSEWAESGGNLLMLGTAGAFGPGGYARTAIEDVMPVRFRPEDAPPRRVLLLLDTSASMGEALSGGVTRLDRLKEGARRVLDALDESELAAVLGFREGVQGDASFLPARDERLAAHIDELTAQGSTHIATSLEQALELYNEGDSGARLLIVTDGEDVEGAGAARYEAIGMKLAARGVRLDVVLTDTVDREWTNWLRTAQPDLHLWQVSGADFDDLLATLDRALADGDLDWVLTQTTSVPGVAANLPRLVRTASRNDPSSSIKLYAARLSELGPSYPLLARRQLVGRTACLCTDSWGDTALAAFWGDAAFQAELNGTLDFLLANAGALNLVLNPLGDGAELVWTGQLAAPAADLETSAGVARNDRPGRWLLETWPLGAQLSVFHKGSLLQQIALPQLVPRELQRTGDDEVFFAVAAEGGIRVFSSLGAWQPRRFAETAQEARDITWSAALLGMLLLLAGFALRRR